MKERMKRFLFYILCIFQSAVMLAQPLAEGGSNASEEGCKVPLFRQLSTHNGLPNSMVHQVAQDETGFVWLATDYGLYRYDGYEVRAYKSDSKNPLLLPSNMVISLAADLQDRLWIGTQEGLCCMRLSTGEVSHYLLSDVKKQRVNSLCVTRSGQVYAGTIRGLAFYDELGDSLIHITGEGKDALGKANIQTIIEDTSGDLLIGTWNKGLYRYNPDKRQFERLSVEATGSSVLSLFEPDDRHLLVGTRTGIVELTFEPGSSRLLDSRQLLKSSEVYAIAAHPDGDSYLIGLREGLGILTSDCRFSMSQPAEFIRSIFRDHYGALWLTSLGGGVFIQDVTTLKFRYSFYRDIHAVCADEQGRLWTAFSKGTDYQGRTILADKRVVSITPSRQGQLLLAVWNDGLWVGSEGSTLQHFTPENCRFMPQRSVSSVLEDRKGNWWVATNQGVGVCYADGREFILADSKHHPLLSEEITDILEDRDGSIWMTTPASGVLHLTGNTNEPDQIACQLYDTENGRLPVNTPLCLYLGDDNTLWLGTEGGGLCCLDREQDRFVSMHQEWHLPGDMVSSIEQDDFGNLWIGTNQGLAQLTVKGAQQGKLRVYTTADGLPDNFFEPRASCQYEGEFHFGTTNGLVSFRPVAEANALSKHQVVVTGVLIDGEPAAVDTVLTIPASARSFRISFASLTFSNQHQCAYTYRLRGFEKKWNNVTADHRMAVYSNLAPGKYVFELKATDDQGNWSDVRTMEVVVEPPFWSTGWAYLIYIICGLVLLYLIVREVRSRMMTRNSLQLQVASDGQTQVVVAHKSLTPDPSPVGEGSKCLRGAAGEAVFFFEIQDLNYTDADEQFLRDAINSVNSHLSDSDYGVPQLVEELATSRSTLFKRLKALTGMNASTFINDIRLKAACRMIDEHSSIRISDLAYQVGFNDPKYFSQLFRKKFGVTPTEYAENKQ